MVEMVSRGHVTFLGHGRAGVEEKLGTSSWGEPRPKAGEAWEKKLARSREGGFGFAAVQLPAPAPSSPREGKIILLT